MKIFYKNSIHLGIRQEYEHLLSKVDNNLPKLFDLVTFSCEDYWNENDCWYNIRNVKYYMYNKI